MPCEDLPEYWFKDHKEFIEEGLKYEDKLVKKFSEASIYIFRNYLDGAIRRLSEYIDGIKRLNCDHPKVLLNLAYGYFTRADVYVKKGDINKALEDYNEAIRLIEAIPEESRDEEALSALGELYVNIGLAYYIRGDLKIALEHFERALSILSGIDTPYAKMALARAYTNIGNVYYKLGKIRDTLNAISESVRILESLLNSELSLPSLVELIKAYSNNAVILMELGKLRDAERILSKALEVSESYLKKLEGDIKEVLVNKALVYLNRGIIRLELGNYSGSEEDFSNAINIFERKIFKGLYDDVPEYYTLLTRAYILRGLARVRLEKKEEALSDFREAIKIAEDATNRSKNAPELLHILAQAYIEGGNIIGEENPLEAIRYFSKAIKILNALPKNYISAERLNDLANAYEGLSKANISLKFFDKAIDAASEAINIRRRLLKRALYSKYSFLYIKSLAVRAEAYIAKGLINRASKDLIEAARILKKLADRGFRPVTPNTSEIVQYFLEVAGKSQSPELCLEIADILDDAFLFAAAVKCYNKAIEMLENKIPASDVENLYRLLRLSDAYNNRGNALADLGRLPEAIRDYKKAIEIKEKLLKDEHIEGKEVILASLAGTYRNLGLVYAEHGLLEDALREINRSIELLEGLGEELYRKPMLLNELKESYSLRSGIYRALGKIEESLRDLDRVVELVKKLEESEFRGN